MKKIRFEKITDEIYYLTTPHGERSVGITLIKGSRPENTVLIDTGANDTAITDYLLPALKAEDISPREIGIVTLTHCHADNIGGLCALRDVIPRIKVIVPHGFTEAVRNPMSVIMKERDVFPMHNPQFQEVRGVYVDRELTPEEDSGRKELAGLRAIRVKGHADGVCWLHSATGTLISGDALQGNGDPYQGMPYYTDARGYKMSLKSLEELPVKILVTSREMDGIAVIERGNEAYRKAIARCQECATEIGRWVKEQYDAGERDVEVIARNILNAHFEGVPDALCFAMSTVSSHIRYKVFE